MHGIIFDVWFRFLSALPLKSLNVHLAVGEMRLIK